MKCKILYMLLYLSSGHEKDAFEKTSLKSVVRLSWTATDVVLVPIATDQQKSLVPCGVKIRNHKYETFIEFKYSIS